MGFLYVRGNWLEKIELIFMSPTDPKNGFTFRKFEHPFEVVAFPNSTDFEPTKGTAIGEEICNTFGTKRLVVRYFEPPVRKSTNKGEHFPNGTLYLSARYVSGWNV